MPGNDDPANTLLPQQQFHRCLFPLSCQLNTFHRVTNPYGININHVQFLGTSGQNIMDMKRYGRANEMECLEISLKSRNIAPTAPDTLSCFPFKMNDPFIINDCPHVYFAGNASKYENKKIKGEQGQIVQLILLPCFAATGQAVLVNLNDLNCQLLQFGVGQIPG